MPKRKGPNATSSPRERKRRFDIVLAVLSGNPLPLKVPGLVALLHEAGHEVDDETPKKWGERGIPERWARLIAMLPRAQEAGLTADWIRDGVGEPPKRVEMKRLAKLQQQGGESTGDDDENGSPSFLDYTLRTTRHLAAAEQEGATPAVQLRILKLAEEIGVEQFGQRAKAFIERERQRIQRG